MGKIDARGRSCPQPVMMTKVHVEKGDEEIEVLLDNAVSASNVQRYLEKNGYSVRIFDEDGSIIIRSSLSSEGVAEVPAPEKPPVQDAHAEAETTQERTRPAPSEEELPRSAAPTSEVSFTVKSIESMETTSYAVLITRKTIGGDDALLGEVLMKGFLGTLSQMTRMPSVVVLMNEGVKLSMKNTSSLDHILVLEKKGVQILVCGTCTNHYGITSDIGAGTISNMFEITESLVESGKIISI